MSLSGSLETMKILGQSRPALRAPWDSPEFSRQTFAQDGAERNKSRAGSYLLPIWCHKEYSIDNSFAGLGIQIFQNADVYGTYGTGNDGKVTEYGLRRSVGLCAAAGPENPGGGVDQLAH